MQRPTCVGLRVRSPSDAHVIFHAVSLGILPVISRRLDTEERRAISSGCIYVWEERGPNAEATGLGIERWTDSIHWGPSRVRDEFLFYHEKEMNPIDLEMGSDSDTGMPAHAVYLYSSAARQNLIKQTYSVFVNTGRGRRKWHLIAYFTQDTVDFLHTIDDYPELSSLQVPLGKFKSARSSKTRAPREAAEQDHPYFGTREVNYSTPIYLEDRRGYHHTSSVSILAPLTYLRNLPPPRRHPLDEKALMQFTPKLTNYSRTICTNFSMM